MQRLRRLRRTRALRDAFAETQVRAGALIYPVFVCAGSGVKEEVPSMPGVFRYSADNLSEVVDAVLSAEQEFEVDDGDEDDFDLRLSDGGEDA